MKADDVCTCGHLVRDHGYSEEALSGYVCDRCACEVLMVVVDEGAGQ